MTEPPLLAIEISSPTQGIQDLVDKARFLMEQGVESCWIVQPPLRAITVFTPDMESTTYSEGTVKDPATEVEVDLDAVFSLE
jgi:Uma2 family endonuclease